MLITTRRRRILPLFLLLLLWDTSTSAVTAAEQSESAVAGQSHVRRSAAATTAQEVCQPHHIHLSVGRLQNQNQSSMTVSFSISSACVGINRHKNKSFGAVRLIGSGGGEGGEEEFLVIGDSDSTKEYDAMSPRRDVGRYYSDLYYHIEINNLRPDWEYSYECLLLKRDSIWSSDQFYLRTNTTMTLLDIINNDDDSIIARSDVLLFTTPPAPGQWHSSGRAVKFAIIGDVAAKEHSKQTIRHLDYSDGVDAILFAGDLAYPGKDHVNWDKW